MAKIVVEIVGKFCDNHSLTIINRNLALELAKHEDRFDVFITPRDHFDPKWKLRKAQAEGLDRLASKPKVAPDIQIRHQYPQSWRWPEHEKTKVVFIQPWDYVRIPSEWQYKFETFADALITPSAWTADNYLHSGMNPERLFVVPNGYDPAIFKPGKEACRFFDDKKLTFAFVGNHQKRKGLDILLQVWKETFTKGEPVRLFIKDNPAVYGRNKLREVVADLPKSSGCAEIVYCDEMLSEEEMASIYRSAQVLVHPYRGESFGMHVQEAVACGAFPIVTQGGPTEEFVPADVGYRIEAQVVVLDMTSPELFATKPGDSLTLMGWHAQALEPKAEALKERLRAIAASPEKEALFAKVRAHRSANTWENVVMRYAEVIERVQGARPTTRRRRFEG
jgi:glycosyltransferase involved in cell wall biosynthesis